MAFMSANELAAYFEDDFDGVEAIVNGAFTVRGILDEQYVDPLGMSAAAPAFICEMADWVALPGDVLDIGARRWTVAVVEPDGTGLQLLRLRVVA